VAATGEFPRGVVRDAVVRSLGRVVDRPCARPQCSTPARATLTFNYATRDVWLERLADDVRPQAYDLCLTHAARTRAPHGWQLRDRRPEEERLPDVPPATPADLGGDRTVAVLAAALRAVRDPVSEDAVVDATSEVGPDVVAAAPAPRPRPVLAARRRAAEQTPPSAEEAQVW